MRLIFTITNDADLHAKLRRNEGYFLEASKRAKLPDADFITQCYRECGAKETWTKDMVQKAVTAIRRAARRARKEFQKLGCTKRDAKRRADLLTPFEQNQTVNIARRLTHPTRAEAFRRLVEKLREAGSPEPTMEALSRAVTHGTTCPVGNCLILQCVRLVHATFPCDAPRSRFGECVLAEQNERLLIKRRPNSTFARWLAIKPAIRPAVSWSAPLAFQSVIVVDDHSYPPANDGHGHFPTADDCGYSLTTGSYSHSSTEGSSLAADGCGYPLATDDYGYPPTGDSSLATDSYSHSSTEDSYGHSPMEDSSLATGGYSHSSTEGSPLATDDYSYSSTEDGFLATNELQTTSPDEERLTQAMYGLLESQFLDSDAHDAWNLLVRTDRSLF